MLSMPRGTDPVTVQRAAREFAQAELGDHKYVMVLHDHQANPHMHISVRAESRHGKRLNPRKADLHRRRETLADPHPALPPDVRGGHSSNPSRTRYRWPGPFGSSGVSSSVSRSRRRPTWGARGQRAFAR
jgi:hypothetical protein